MQTHVETSLLPVCRHLQTTSWATAIRLSEWMYPFIQLIHFSGLSLWLGTNVAGDLRLLGVGKKAQTAVAVRDELFMWNWIGFGIAVLGGFLLFSARATMYIVNPAFRAKLFMLIPAALVWHIIVQVKTKGWGKSAETALVGKLAGLLELLLWISVVTAAVEIPNY
ncbi:MAG: DUF6644 family protein [Candidatus Acidiferrales bacterium]